MNNGLPLAIRKPALMLVFVLFILPLPTRAQEFVWANKADVSILSHIDARGNSALAGNFGHSFTFEDTTILDASPLYPGVGNIFWGKSSPSGQLQYLYTNQGTGYVSLLDATMDTDGNLYLLAEFSNNIIIDTASITGEEGVHSYFIARINTEGRLVWIKTLYNDFDQYSSHMILFEKIACDRENNIFVSGAAKDYLMDGFQLGSTGTKRFFAKLEPLTGTTLWVRRVFSQNQSIVSIMDFTFDPDNSVYLTGEFLVDCTLEGGNTLTKSGGGAQRDAYVCKYNENGSFQWISQVEGNLSSGTVGLNFSGSDQLTYVAQHRIRRYNAAGQLIMENTIPATTGYMYIDHIAKDRNADYLCATFTDQFSYDGINIAGDGNATNIIFKTNPSDGTLLWHTEPHGWTTYEHLSSNGKGLLQFSGSALYGADFGIHKLLPPNPSRDNFSIGQQTVGFHTMLVDTTFNSGSNLIRGRVFSDTLADCLYNAEPGLNRFTVIAEPGPYFALSDEHGNYTLRVDTGEYYISQLSPNSHAFVDTGSCPADSLPVYFATSNNTSDGNDFGTFLQSCTLLRVGGSDVNLPDQATQAIYTITLCNDGLDTAKSTTLTLKYPGGVTVPVSSTPAFTGYNPLDSTLSFELGDVEPDTCITILVTDSLVPGSYQFFQKYPYQVSVTPLNVCYATDSSVTQLAFSLSVQLPIDIDELGRTNAHLLFPNPTEGIIMIKGLTPAAKIQVYDIVGRPVGHLSKNNAGVQTVDITHAPDGLYFVQITDKGQRKGHKMIKRSGK